MSEEQRNLDRIVSKLGVGNIVELLAEQISGSDLNTLLLAVFREKTKAASAADLLKRYQENRFVKPAEVNPLQMKQLELDILNIAREHSFAPVQLSPIAPLGSCSIVAAADQNKIISALRGTEVVADATNLLALHVSDGLKSGTLDNRNGFVRFSTTHRHARAQKFKKAPGMLPHFHLFCMVSSGVDQGSYSFEISSFWEHIKVYRHLFQSLFQSEIEVALSARSGYKDSEGLVRRILQYGERHSINVNASMNPVNQENQYYKGLQFTIIANIRGNIHQIGDGGIVDWTQQLLGNKKERFMISAIGLDRLLL
jgi:hypothetical protein